MIYICIPVEYQGCELIYQGNWDKPILLENYDFKIDENLFYIIEDDYNYFTENEVFSYKIKIDGEYKLIEDYLEIEEGKYKNNCIKKVENDFYDNGRFKIKSKENWLEIKIDDKNYFEGEARCGIPCGKGKEYFNDGKNICFEGEYKNGIRSGFGIYYNYSGGKIYEGECENGTPNGYGTIYYENGNKMYEGNWEDDTYHGEGVKYYENGGKEYEGEWKYNEKNGKGTSYYENGNKEYEGEWKDDNFCKNI